MRIMNARLLALTICLAGCAGGGGHDAPPRGAPAEEQALVVYTVNYPLAYFAERIGGDGVEVVFPAPAGEDPAYWSPDGDAIAAYQAADLILLNGAGYAAWIDRATLPASRLVTSSATFADRLIRLEDTVTHSHGPQGDHEHAGLAFTTWLDPTLAREQARAVAATLEQRLRESTPAIRERLTGLEEDLARLDARLAATAASLDGVPLLFSHPVYQYLIRRYGLDGRELHWEPDATPDASAWRELEGLLATHPARWMFWEGEPLPETVARLQALGVRSAVFDPCGNTPGEGDFMTVMAANAEALSNAVP